MSEYGRLWQQMRDIRDQLVILVPGTNLNDWSSVAAARDRVSKRTRALEELVSQWETLENDAAKLRDE